MEKNDGGPAFPTDAQSALRHDHYEGMTLRDYFAAKAMWGMLACGAPHSPADRARLAYETADAMLKSREPHP